MLPLVLSGSMLVLLVPAFACKALAVQHWRFRIGSKAWGSSRGAFGSVAMPPRSLAPAGAGLCKSSLLKVMVAYGC